VYILYYQISWSQLGIHNASMGILNIGGYYDSLLLFIHEATNTGLLNKRNLKYFCVSTDPSGLLDKIDNHVSPSGFLQPGDWTPRSAI
jgi:predicted Rossmann-fold nucleotide-binding protein